METHTSKANKFFYTWFILFLVWLAFTSSIEITEVLTGILISAIISTFSYKSFTHTGLNILTPRKILYMIKYVFVFIKALIIANLSVAKIVINPKLPINPGIVEFESKLKSPFAKMILANTITLTPGTLTVDVVDNNFFIHWIYVTATDGETTYKEIAEQFESILLKIYN